MGLFDKVATNLGIQTDGNVEMMDVAAYAKLPADHPVVLLADRAATRGLGASDMEMRQFFGDPTARDAVVPVAPRAETPARYNWVARRTVDQMLPRMEESHVDRRIPREIRLAINGAAADMIDPFMGDRGSVVSSRLRDEAAISRRVVGYLQASPYEVARRGVEMLSDASDGGLRAEFEMVPGTLRMRIPQDARGRQAWIEERSRTEHALARAGALPAGGMLDAASRMDMVAQHASEEPLMESYVHPEIIRDAASVLGEANEMNDLDLRFRFKELGGMGGVQIPSGPERSEWIMSMLVEERQSRLLSGEQREALVMERRSIESTLPQIRPLDIQRQQQVKISFALNAAQAAGM